MSDLHKDCVVLLSKALGVSEDEINSDTSIHTHQAWDSLAHLRLVLALEEKLDQRLTPDKLVSIVDYSSVSSILLETE